MFFWFTLITSGCAEDFRSRVVQDGPLPVLPSHNQDRAVYPLPGTEVVAKRVLQVGGQIVQANPEIGIRPMFITLGSPKPELFHKGGLLDGYQIIISEGMVKLCTTDEQLAAVLCHELGKTVSERDSIMGPATRGAGDPPFAESIGSDVAGTFGSPDGTFMMERAKYEKKLKTIKKAPVIIPSPDVLARKYLYQAGYVPTALDAASGILRMAEDSGEIQQQFNKTQR